MLRAVGLSRTFGGRVLLDPTDWFLGDTERVGLVGPNGSGKSTFLKMLAGLESPDGGRVEMPRGQRVGYLPQFGFWSGDDTVYNEAAKAFARVLELRTERERIERALEADTAPEQVEALLARHDRIEHEIRTLDGYEMDRRIHRVLTGLGFSPSDFTRLTQELSGGWQMRVTLARLLLEAPEVLLLDEPTNHLDIEAREWLEGYLRDYPGSFVLVSHDRYFLDVTVQRITDIMGRALHDYTGNYSRYLVERESRYELALKAYERQQEEIRRIQVFIDRFRYKNTKASQVQSRIKMLEKMPRLEPPQSPERTIRFRFPQPERTGRIVAELRGVRKTYGPIRVFEGIDLVLERGQKVALVGPNGAGKSTLMRILGGVEGIDGGTVTTGLRVTLDHFAQDQADRLPGGSTILEEAMRRSPHDFVPQIRGLLGAFLFSGEAVDKRIGVLSGGERNRLALAFMLMNPANVLLLDEPTNHLDMQAKEVLLEALRSFTGTVIFVSHDRYFLAGLADRVIEIGGGRIREHPGDYESYVWKKESEAAAAAREADAPRASASTPGGSGTAGPGSAGSSTPAASSADSPGVVPSRSRPVKRRARQLRELEEKIGQLEQRKARLEELLAREDLYRDPEKSGFYLSEYQELTRELEGALEEWAAGEE